ncbi:hypothetical protein HNP40_000073 [Mycobacteroides chelonae]|nr:hypothetical protein [Mycobacteroides chelonae]
MGESNTVPAWVNKMVRGVLRSPLHPVLSSNIAPLTFTGRTSGKEYNVAATALVGGKRLDGTAELTTGPQIAGPPAELLHKVPRDAKYHNVRRNAHGSFNQSDIDRAAAGESMVTIRLS